MVKTARFSTCRLYRYDLFRLWDITKPYVAFICLNPSTADELNDDPTVRRSINYAKGWGYGGFCMLNIFSYRATDPKLMKVQNEPVGPDNDYWIQEIAQSAGIVVCAWGTHGAHLNRGVYVRNMLTGINLYHLGLSKEGYPKHPLYLKKDLQPTLWID